ncbi:MAG: glycosyltransferase family 2 protein [Anaerolineaceae bacterium]|nr:glycosyltransferase family 2 protein [Anaerolineaceae bacterium]
MKPFVSIIIPCFNEGKTIAALLKAIKDQTYPISKMEVVIADGLSTDDTHHVIREFQISNPQLRIIVVDNPKRIIPAGVNTAVRASRGEIIIRLDGHSKPYPDYVEKCVNALENKLGDNVGGVWEIKPSSDTWLADSIAMAASHPLGVGDAQYRLGYQSGAVDTVPFGAFKRRLFDEIGGFNEDLLTNEDYEFNTRIRQAGGVVWLDTSIRTIYLARPNLQELARQYFRYGYWKFKMLRKFPNTLRWRQALPPLFVVSLVFLGLLSIFFQPAWILLSLELILYLGILFVFGAIIALKHHRIGCIIGFPAAIATMHVCWGTGFLWSSIK